jgi:hypothetical protein
MRIHAGAPAVLAALAMMVAAAPQRLEGQTAGPAAGTAKGALSVAGKRATLAHAVAFNAGARIYVVLSDQVIPPDQGKSEFELAMYEFNHKVVGLELTLDHTRKVTETAYRWDLGKHVCAGCFDVAISGGADGPLTGSVKTTAKGQAEKLNVDVAFSAPFAKPSAVKK